MQPLQGKRILVTRGQSQARSFIDRIEAEGGGVYHTPLLSFQLNDSESHQEVLKRLHDYSWVFITSANGVKFFFELLKKYKVEVPPSLKFSIIGSKTEKRLKGFGIKADFIPSKYHASSMGKEFLARYPQPGPILYIRGNRSRDALPRMFDDKGVFFHSMTVYDTLLVEEKKTQLLAWIQERKIDALTFTSPSTVRAFVSMVGEKGLEIPCFCIGPTTAKEAEKWGFTNVHVPEQFTITHMLKQMTYYFSNEGKR
ncbi:uroporphyrinogen-III synthase [Halobacillus litoralis]|uniref:Uroporphyrinogen-III synthase n=1 Tax=Halobacillus litoralis TaxID=45668 RepID=A0A845FCM1_9BACI|nr:uroporphyrinogen-III synthase [Halobacillus litoralis]MYL72212.1 uroporphyrinogen-III synthase [Halobacillus litoralis]